MRGDAMRLAFFDLDDTIYDRTHLRIGALLGNVPYLERLRSSEDAVADAVARVSRLAPLFEWFGFPNLRHHSESPEMIAVLTVLYGDPSRLPDAWGITPELQETFLRAVIEVERILGRSDGGWPAQLFARLAFHSLVQSSGVYERLAGLAGEIASSDEVLTAHARVRERQVWQAYEGFKQSWSMFEQGGARCFIASNGEEEIQKEKLSQLGLERAFESRLLTTGRASSPLDADALRCRVDELLTEAASGDAGERALELVLSEDTEAEASDVGAFAPKELVSLFPFVWVLDRFGHKTPDFYARVLHAVVASPDDPRGALDRLSFAAPSAWDAARPQLVMVGDNYDRDVTPLVELLGGDQGWTVLLRLGRYSRRAEDIAPGRAPAMQFDDWSALRAYLSSSFAWDAVPPITHAPPACPSCVSEPRLFAHAPATPFNVVSRLHEAARSCG